MISLRTSGPLEVLVDGNPAPPGLRWRKHAALLVYLACSPRQTRTRSHLLGLLWGDRPESAARHSLNEALRVIRRAGGGGAVRCEADLVALEGTCIDCDALRFDAAFADRRWLEAASCIGGEFLEGFDVTTAPGFEDWVAAERDRRRANAVDALVAAADALLDEGRIEESRTMAQRATGLDACSERAARARMRASALAGDPAAALAEFARLREALGTVGASPGAETAALLERIRRQPIVPSRPAGADDSRRTPLIARERELAALLAALDRCREDARPALLIIDGDGGAGRSRLLEEAVARARLRGFVASVARAIESDLPDPAGGIEALASGGLLDAPGVPGAAPASIATLAHRLPAWADRFRDARQASTGTTLHAAFADLVRAGAEAGPLLLAVDDAHWLERESLLTLVASLRDPGRRVALLLAIDAGSPRDEIDGARARIGRELDGAAVRLAPFEQSAVESLTGWAMPEYGGEARARLARRIHADSGGLPMLAVELLHAVRHGLELNEGAAWPAPSRTLDATRPGELPDAVVAAVRIGFRRLRDEARAALCALAVLEGRAPAEVVAAGAALDDEAAIRALDELEWGRWVAAEARGYRFAAAVAREVIARDMVTPGQRQRILRRAGRLTGA